MKTTIKPTRFPQGFPEGPWGVNTIGNDWYVIHKTSGRAKKIGRIIGIATPAKSRWNYCDRAKEEAARRNAAEPTHLYSCGCRIPAGAEKPTEYAHLCTSCFKYRPTHQGESQ